MSNPLQKSVRKLRGRKVRVVANDGREYVGWLERIGNGGHLVLRDAEDLEAGERVDPAHIRAPKSVVGVDPGGRVERIAIEEISPAPYHAREFDASENRGYIDQVRDDSWTGSFPVVRGTDDGLEVLEGHKRLWVAEQAGLQTHPVRIVDIDAWAAARRFVADHLPDERHVEDGETTTSGYYGASEIAEAVATLIERWDDRALELKRVAWNADRLGLEVSGRDEPAESELESEGADSRDEESSDDEADVDDSDDEYWCPCGYGPSSEAGVARHQGHAHDDSKPVLEEPPTDSDDQDDVDDRRDQDAETESSSDEDLTAKRVLEELRTMVEGDGYGWVKSKDLADRLDTSGQKVGHRLRVLRGDDRVERYNENAAAASWRPTDADTDGTDETSDQDQDEPAADGSERDDDEDPFIRASRSRKDSDESADSTEDDTHQTESKSPSEAHDVGLEESDADDTPAADAGDDVDEDEDERKTFPRDCHCGATLEDSLELAIHRTEEHGVSQAVLGHLEPGEFGEIVADAETLQDIIDATGFSPERTMRTIGVYGLKDVVGPDGVELSDVNEFEFDGLVDEDLEDGPDEELAETDEESPEWTATESGSQSVVNDGGAVAFSDWSAPDGSDTGSGTRCQNCGSHVDKQFAKVFEPESEGAPRCCPNCEHLVREADGTIRRKRGQGNGGESA